MLETLSEFNGMETGRNPIYDTIYMKSLFWYLGVLAQLVNSNRITLYENQAKIATTNFSSLRYASLNLPHQVALRGRRIPSPARYSFAALAITALPDSPALRREP